MFRYYQFIDYEFNFVYHNHDVDSHLFILWSTHHTLFPRPYNYNHHTSLQVLVYRGYHCHRIDIAGGGNNEMGEGTPNLAFLVEFSRPSTLINVFVSIDGHLLRRYKATTGIPSFCRLGPGWGDTCIPSSYWNTHLWGVFLHYRW